MNAKRGTKRIFYDCIVCITPLGIKFTKVAVVHMCTCSFCLTARTCIFLTLFQGCVRICCHYAPDIQIQCHRARARAADGLRDFAVVLIFAYPVSTFPVLNVAWRIIQTPLEVELLLPD